MILMALMTSISSAYLKPQLILRGTIKLYQSTALEEAGFARVSLLAGEAMLADNGLPRTRIPKLDGTPFKLDVDGTVLTYRMYDQDGLIDLNLAPPKLLRLYFNRLGLSDTFTDSFLENRKSTPQKSLLRFQSNVSDHRMATFAIVGSDQGRLSYRTTPMELLVFLAGSSGARGDLIAKIGRPNFVSGRVEVVLFVKN